MITTITITVEGKNAPRRKGNTIQLKGDKLQPDELKGLVKVIEAYIQADDGERIINGN